MSDKIKPEELPSLEALLDHISIAFRHATILKSIGDLTDVKNNNRHLVIAANAVIELLVTTLVKHHCQNAKSILENRMAYSHAVKLLILNELKVINKKMYGTLKELNRVRNDAAHTAFYRIGDSDMASLSAGVSKRPFPTDQLFDLCRMIIFMLWSHHDKIFHKEFGDPPEGIRTGFFLQPFVEVD